MNGLAQRFVSHPIRLAGVLVAFTAVAVIVWYLGSPLFVRTYTNEALPQPLPTAQQGAAPQPSAATAAPASSRPLATGELGFVDALHNGKGPVRIVELGGQRFVRFEDVAISNAPDVHVYLSRETGGKWSEGTSLYLGPLKATNGSFNYELPETADVAVYHSVVVWCRAFGVLITWADLSPA